MKENTLVTSPYEGNPVNHVAPDRYRNGDELWGVEIFIKWP
jgi:hypothetical protein